MLMGRRYIASFPGSPSFRAIIPYKTFDPWKEGEPVNKASKKAYSRQIFI